MPQHSQRYIGVILRCDVGYPILVSCSEEWCECASVGAHCTSVNGATGRGGWKRLCALVKRYWLRTCTPSDDVHVHVVQKASRKELPTLQVTVCKFSKL